MTMKLGTGARAHAPCEPRVSQTHASRFDILILSGRAKGVTFPIDAPGAVLGRGPGADLVFHDPALHRAHLEVATCDDRVRVRTLWPGDTFLWRGRKVSQAYPRVGDIVDVGAVRFQIERRKDDAALERGD